MKQFALLKITRSGASIKLIDAAAQKSVFLSEIDAAAKRGEVLEIQIAEVVKTSKVWKNKTALAAVERRAKTPKATRPPAASNPQQ